MSDDTKIIANAISDALTTCARCDASGGLGGANAADGLFAIADAINGLADAIKQLASKSVED